jgi:hypothetical protein
MEVHTVIRQGISSASWGRRLAVAVGLAGLLSAIAFVTGGPPAAQARGDGNSDCVTVPLGSQSRAICTYLDTASVDLGDLLAAVDASEVNSGIWIQAWGGWGGQPPEVPGNTGGSGEGGAGGAGGYAQTYYDNLASYIASFGDPAVSYLYYGGNGSGHSSTRRYGAGGGASTLVASADVTEGSAPDHGPCIEADPGAVDQDGRPIAVEFHSANGARCPQSVAVGMRRLSCRQGRWRRRDRHSRRCDHGRSRDRRRLSLSKACRRRRVQRGRRTQQQVPERRRR